MFSKVAFEIQLERDGRWITEASAGEESQAYEICHRLLKTREDCTAARIVRQTTSVMGNSREGVIFQQLRAEYEIPLTVTGNPETAPVCADADAVYALPGRMAGARLLKTFMDKYQIVPLELLHNQSYLKKFDDATSFMTAVFHQLGTAQGKKLNIPAQQRSDELTGYYKEIRARANKFTADRKNLPLLLMDNITTTYDALLRHDIKAAQFHFNALVAYEFQTGTYVAREQKLGTIINWFAATTEKELRRWLDEWVADFLCFPEIIDGILGAQFNFYEFLLRLIEVADGKKQLTKAKDTPHLVPLRAALASGYLPYSQAVLVDRLIREIRSEKPLDKRDPEREEPLIKELEKALKQDDGSMLGGRAVEDAIATRKLRERKRKLRAMGLDDVADNLG